MKASLVLGAALAAALSFPAFAETKTAESFHYRHHHHAMRPYANRQGDQDGLSRKIDDCNKGCIGGNPS